MMLHSTAMASFLQRCSTETEGDYTERQGKKENGRRVRREGRRGMRQLRRGWSGDSPDDDVEELGSSIWESGIKRLIGRAWKLRRSGGLVGIDGWMGR